MGPRIVMCLAMLAAIGSGSARAGGDGDWRASQTGEGAGEFVIRLQAQLLF